MTPSAVAGDIAHAFCDYICFKCADTRYYDLARLRSRVALTRNLLLGLDTRTFS